MKIPLLLLFLVIATTHSLPVLQSAVVSSDADEGNSTENSDMSLEVDQPSSLGVQIDRFAYLISTHWQFDHLESIITNSYKHIADEMQSHIQIDIQSTSPGEKQQQHVMQAAISDAVDLDLLKAQIFGAVQSHTQGSLPNVWDKLGDKLSRPAMEAYVRNLVLTYCERDENDHVDYDCLADHASQLLSELDRYVATHLTNVFAIMNTEFLPDLLEHTAKDLEHVLNYFNSAYLNKDDVRIALHVVPWQHEQDQVQSRLFDLAASATKASHRSPNFITEFARMASI